MENKYSITYIDGIVRIYINKLLHFRMPIDDEIIFQSYKRARDWYTIEFSNKDGIKITKLEYNKSEKWKAILELLNEIKL